MILDLPAIEKLTREAFSMPQDQALESQEIIKGGSGRRFYRVTKPDLSWCVVVMHFTLERPENARFETATHFLEANKINVPSILACNSKSNLLWLTDLGTCDLGSSQNEDWNQLRAPLYQSALTQAFKIHTIPIAQKSQLPPLEPPFDTALYQWEQDYFFKEFAAHFSTSPENDINTLCRSEEAGKLIDELSNFPRQLIHRDYQSQNIMIRDGDAWLIDYQGMRLGLPEYDIASLLFDPYVSISETQRDKMISYYFSLKQNAGHTDSLDNFRHRLFLCATQRLMQALGAYAFLGINKDKKSFLQHIPLAVERLHELAVKHQTFPGLASILSLKK